MMVLVLLLLVAIGPGCSPNSKPDAANGYVQAANIAPAAPSVAVRSAMFEVRDLQRTVEAVGSLVEQGLLSKLQLDEQQARYNVAEAILNARRENVRNIRAAITSRRASLALAPKKFADAQIIDPMSGFIKERLISEGMYLKVSGPVVSLVQNSPLKLRFDVPENVLDSVRVNGLVQFQVDLC